MTPEQLRADLDALGLNPPAFCARVKELGGEDLSPRAVQFWLSGDRATPALLPALLRVLRRLPSPHSAAPSDPTSKV